MAEESADGGPATVAMLAGLFGTMQVVFGVVTIVGGAPSTQATVLAGGQAVLGALLLPTAVGLLHRSPSSRWVGILAFGGIAVIQTVQLLSRSDPALPAAGVVIASLSTVYLLLAPGAIGETDDDRPVDEETDPHDFGL